jgi:ParB family transcriptional regulator, chromosome partitioning protein
MTKNYGLGRGLSSLIPAKKITEPDGSFNYFGKNNAGDVSATVEEKNFIQEVDLQKIIPNPHQPRTNFDAEKLQELAASIQTHGIIQPIVVSAKEGQFEIIAGERRFQAAKLAGLKKVPVVVREASEIQKLELAIIENIQRHDLNPIEEAASYLKLANEFDLEQDEISLKVGKSRSAVANKIRLLKLPREIQRALMEGRINEGHAKAILAIESPEKQMALFELILKNSLTVRQTEEKTKEVSVRTHKRHLNINPVIKNIEDRLNGILGTKVKLTQSGQGGKIILDYYSEEELNSLLQKFSRLSSLS